VTIDLSGIKNDDDARLNDRALCLNALTELRLAGVEAIIDQTACGMGRNPVYTQSVCDDAGIEIYHATGFYKEPFLPDICYTSDEITLSNFFVSEILHGIENTNIRASLIGEVGSGLNEISLVDSKMLRAAARAHAETGTPLCTHCSLGTMAMEQIEILTACGADLSHVVLSHIDLSDNLDYMLSILDTGANVGFDTIGKLDYLPDENRIARLMELCQRGYSGQIVLSMDITRKSKCIDPGYCYLITNFLPLLRDAGAKDIWLSDMLWHNPRRIYRMQTV
jgi:phosphotriesterase-related protein